MALKCTDTPLKKQGAPFSLPKLLCVLNVPSLLGFCSGNNSAEQSALISDWQVFCIYIFPGKLIMWPPALLEITSLNLTTGLCTRSKILNTYFVLIYALCSSPCQLRVKAGELFHVSNSLHLTYTLISANNLTLSFPCCGSDKNHSFNTAICLSRKSFHWCQWELSTQCKCLLQRTNLIF